MKQELGNLMAEDPQQETINLLTYRLTAVTEQRDELLRYNEAFRKETLICADCDSISKEEYDQAIEQRDRLAEAVNAATILIAAKGRHNTMLAYNGLRDALQSLTTNAETIYGEKDSD